MNQFVSLDQKLRINGDWIDHIKQMGELISSLDVRLLDGHIDNITRFKLFLRVKKQ